MAANLYSTWRLCRYSTESGVPVVPVSMRENSGTRGEEEEAQMPTVKTGAEYWDLMERTARKVDKWPAWKTGERSKEE